MTSNKPTKSECTPDVIKAFKNEHGKVFKYVTEDKKFEAYFKNPDVEAMEAATVMASTKPISSNKLLAKACFLGGDREVFEDAKYLLGLGKKLQQVVEIVEGELEVL